MSGIFGNRGVTTFPVEPHERNPNTSLKYRNTRLKLKFDPDDEIGCFRCGNPASYNFEFDSNYCDNCNTWLEGVCTPKAWTPPCPFCPTRPKYPKYPG